MSEPFRRGDIAIVLPNPMPLRRSNAWIERYNGQEVQLIRWYDRYWWVRPADGCEFGVIPELLRKKRPPPELGSWDDPACVWRPHKATA